MAMTRKAMLLAIAFAWLVIGYVPIATWGQVEDIERAKKLMDGTWGLAEWVVDGELMRPPEVDGRLSHHDGTIMIMMSWTRPGLRKFFYGYGTYEFGDATWSYAYDRYVAFTDTNGSIALSEKGAAESATRAGFEGRRTYQMKFDGDKLILEREDGQRQLIYEGNVFSYVEHGKPLRKWRRSVSQ